MWKMLNAVNARLVYAIPAAMALGLSCGLLGDARLLKMLIVPLTFIMVYPMMVNLRAEKVLDLGDSRAQLLAQGINFLLVPFLALGLGKAFFADAPAMALGLLLAGLVPTSGMTISWTGFAKGNLEAAVKMTVIGLLLGTLLTPFYVQALMGENVEVDMPTVMGQIALVVFLPMLLGQLTRYVLLRKVGSEAFRRDWAPRFPALSTLGVLGIVFVAMALKARAVAASPELLLAVLAPLAILYTINFALSTVVAKLLLSRGDGIALVYGTVMRNLSIALAIALNAFGEHGSGAALVIALAYVIQVQAAAWYVRFTDRIYGPAALPKEARA